jgi:hypothetical protein
LLKKEPALTGSSLKSYILNMVLAGYASARVSIHFKAQIFVVDIVSHSPLAYSHAYHNDGYPDGEKQERNVEVSHVVLVLILFRGIKESFSFNKNKNCLGYFLLSE